MKGVQALEKITKTTGIITVTHTTAALFIDQVHSFPNPSLPYRLRPAPPTRSFIQELFREPHWEPGTGGRTLRDPNMERRLQCHSSPLGAILRPSPPADICLPGELCLRVTAPINVQEGSLLRSIIRSKMPIPLRLRKLFLGGGEQQRVDKINKSTTG